MLECVKTELSKSFDFSGRTPRIPYLIFLASSILIYAICALITYMIVGEDSFMRSLAIITAVFYILVTSAGVRRLHDVGEEGALMLGPLKPISAYLIFSSLLQIIGSFFYPMLILLFLFAFDFFMGLSLILWLASVSVIIVATLMYFSHVMGLLLLPSQPGSNKYGPNPHEVLQ